MRELQQLLWCSNWYNKIAANEVFNPPASPLLEQKSRYGVIERMREEETEQAGKRTIKRIVEDTFHRIGGGNEVVFRHGR